MKFIIKITARVGLLATVFSAFAFVGSVLIHDGHPNLGTVVILTGCVATGFTAKDMDLFRV
jgi:hypothetical protein